MNRTELFDAIRPYAPDRRFLASHVQMIDALADAFKLPKPDAAPRASGVDLPADYWPMLSKIESGDRPYIKAPTSSASGLYQFIKATWEGEGGRWGGDPSMAFGGLRPTVDEQTGRARTFTAKNAVILLRAGIRINKATLYAAHFLGAPMAVKLLGAGDAARADAIAGDAATRANPSILKGKTVADFKAWLKRKTGDDA